MNESTELPLELVSFRDQLVGAIERDMRRYSPRTRSGRPVLRGGVAVVVVATAGLAVISPWKNGPSTIARAKAALAPSANVVVHVKVQGTQLQPDGSTTVERYESWEHSGGNSARSVTPFQPGRISSRDGTTVVPSGPVRALESGETFDPATHTLRDYAFDPVTGVLTERLIGGDTQQRPALGSEATDLRHRLDAGAMKDAGLTEVRGRRVRRLRGAVDDANRWHTVQTYYVDAVTFAPVRFEARTTLGGRIIGTVERDYLVYEFLPATPANLALTSVTDAHPAVHVVEFDSLKPSERPGYVQGGG